MFLNVLSKFWRISSRGSLVWTHSGRVAAPPWPRHGLSTEPRRRGHGLERPRKGRGAAAATSWSPGISRPNGWLPHRRRRGRARQLRGLGRVRARVPAAEAPAYGGRRRNSARRSPFGRRLDSARRSPFGLVLAAFIRGRRSRSIAVRTSPNEARLAGTVGVEILSPRVYVANAAFGSCEHAASFGGR